MSAPLISILLPVYNAASSIEAAVRSCLSQTFRDFELLLIDDGSTDATPALLQNLAKTDPRIRVLSLPHAGVRYAFNAGIAESSGTFIARMDSDDEMHPERLQKQLQFLQQHPQIGLVSSLVQHGGDAKAQEGYAAYIDWINTLVTPEEIARNRFVESPICNPSILFRRSVAEQFGACREGDFPEDYELWLRWLENGVQMAKVPEVLLTWNDPPTRLTRTNDDYSPDAFARIKAVYLARFLREKTNGRAIWLCGAGRITRKKSDFLRNEISIAGYIDVDPKKSGTASNGLPVLGINDIPSKEKSYIVSYITNRGAREAIRKLLTKKGFEEESDFILAG